MNETVGTGSSSLAVPSHTPGPWAVEDPMEHELWIVQEGKETYEWFPIATCQWPDEDMHLVTSKQVKANARLIAAAPDLLATLRALHSACVEQGIKLGPLVADAEAAISKAEGRSSPQSDTGE